MTSSPLGRVVEIAEPGLHLARHRGFLVVTKQGSEIGRVALDDLVAVIVTNAATTTSCVLLAELGERAIPFVQCGANFAPISLMWPLAGHHAQQRRMEAQATASKSLQGRLWQKLITAKIHQQGAVLKWAGQRGGGFDRLAAKVKPNDADNVEALAARRYWPLLFGPEFRRDIDGGGINSLLNYGYAVLRAATARALAAAGLHPGLGIFHRHPYNPMPLADDVMEPFRPVIDRTVATLAADLGPEISTQAKHNLVAVLRGPLLTRAGRSPLNTCLVRLASSLAESFTSGHANLDLPLAAGSLDTTSAES